MKTVFLIFYFWHSTITFTPRTVKLHSSDSTSQTGGPIFELKEMPNLATCEAVGAKAKDVVDKAMPTDGRFATYGCVEVTTPQPNKK
jgi:hypothetical protein